MTGAADILLQLAADVFLDPVQVWGRMREAEQAHQHALAELTSRAELAERAAERDFSRSLSVNEHLAGCRVWEQLTIDTEKARREASPFRLPESDIRAIAAAVTAGGRLPALIVAPFLNDAGELARPDPGRQIWWRVQQRAGWTVSLASLTGHLRPAEYFDVDLSLIRSALDRLPFVLVHGDVQADQVAIRIVGSGLLDGEEGRGRGGPDTAISVCGALPLPDPAGSGRLAGDALDSVVACAGALGEVSRLVRQGELPHLHALVPAALRSGVAAVIIGGYSIAAQGIASASTERARSMLRGLQELAQALPDDDGGIRRRAEGLLVEIEDHVLDRQMRAAV
jgi:hypothetical protein